MSDPLAQLDRMLLEQRMTALLGDVIEENLRYDGGGDESEPPALSASTALIGPEAVVSSVTLVSFITDVEMMLSEEWELELTLVSEEALSRKRSPFRTLGSLTDLVMELSGNSEAAA